MGIKRNRNQDSFLFRMLSSNWGVTKQRTARYEVDKSGNIIGTLPNRIVPRDKFVLQEENVENEEREFVPVDDDDDDEGWVENEEQEFFPVDDDGEEWFEKTERPIKKPRVRKVKTDVDDGPDPPPPMPQEFKDRILEEFGNNSSVISEEILVMQKRIEMSDCDKTKNRLSIPRGKVRGAYFTDDDRRRFPLVCKMVSPNLTVNEVKLSKWKIFHALNGGWKEVRIGNDIVPGLIVQLWAVRVDRVLTFVLVDITTPEERERLIAEAKNAKNRLPQNHT